MLIPFFALTLGASFPLGASPPWCGARFAQGGNQSPEAPSLAGLPGLMQVPTATALADRSLMMAINTAHTHQSEGARSQRNVFLGFGILPRVSLVARGTSLTKGPGFYDNGIRDRSASVQLLALKERGPWPAVAFGAHDVGGQNFPFKARYGVASRSLTGRLRLTAGYGQRERYTLSGAFGGLELAPCQWITLMAEHDGTRRNLGLRLEPLSAWGSRFRVAPTVDVLWREGDGRVLGAGLRLLPPRPALITQPVAPARSVAVPARSHPVPDVLPEALPARLAAHGFENIRVAVTGDTLDVAYENRRYNREEWDALGVVLAEMAHGAAGAHWLRATMLRVDLPVLQLLARRDAFLQLVEGTITPDAFAAHAIVSHPAALPASTPVTGNAVTNASRLHLDITIRPRVEHILLSEISVAEARVSALPEATLHLGRGITVTGRKTIVAAQSHRFPDLYANPNADQLAVHITRPGIPLITRGGGALTQVSIGQFAPGARGGAISTDAVLAGGRWSLGGVAAAFGEEITRIQRSVLLGSVRYRYAPLDLTTSLSAGRYFHGDMGAAFELERRFGLLEIALYARATETANIAGYRISFPTTFRRDPRPGRVRVRLPEYYDFTHWKTVMMKPAGILRTDVGIPLTTGQELARSFRMRDRLHAVRLGRDMAQLRDAARAWRL